jgi:SAM-dependent methyltransferase
MEKVTLQSLTDSLWSFSVLMSLSEAGALPLLEKGTTFEALLNKTNMPLDILKTALELLKTMGFISEENGLIKANGDLARLLEVGGASRTLGEMQSNFGQVRELITASRQHTLTPGWSHTDKDILQAQGVFSEFIATECVPLFPKMKALVQKSHAKFLDVGAGVGRIALKMCELYPQLQAVAIEPIDAPFLLAQQNISASDYKDRVELRQMGVEDLTDIAIFDVIWIAQGFIPDEAFLPAIAKMKSALKPGGMILTAEFIENSMKEKTIKSGVMDFISAVYGTIRTPSEIMALFEKNGFVNVEQVQYGEYVSLIAAVNP